MTSLIFPIEAFDDTASYSRLVSEHVNQYGGRFEHYMGYFVFRKDLQELCISLDIPDVLELQYSARHLSEVIYMKTKAEKEYNTNKRNELLDMLGLPKNYTGNFMTLPNLPMTQFEIIKWCKSAFIDSIPKTKFLLLHDEIEIPEHLMEKYLMVKLAI